MKPYHIIPVGYILRVPPCMRDAWPWPNALKACTAVVACLLLCLQVAGQTKPDSTAVSGGKGAIKGQSTISDSLPPSDTLIIIATDTPVVDSVPTDTTIGPVRKKKEKQPRIKVGQDRPLPDPKIAVRRSLILPGLGQAYNRSWWKIPIVYGGFAVFTYFIIDQNQQYQYHRKAAICKGDETCDSDALYPEFALFDINSVIARRDFYRRNRDLNVIIATLWYTLQAIDAYVDAHLKGFNVSQDLSLHVRPGLMADPYRKSNLMMGASLSLKLHR